MLKKLLLFDNELSDRFAQGVRDIAAAVKSTLGPGGNPVIIQRPKMSPLITKDGVTVAQHIRPSDPFQELISQAVIEIADKTNQNAGDGTTTAVVLAEAIYNLGKEYLRNDNTLANAILVRQMLDTVEQIKVQLDTIKKPVTDYEEIVNVAKISANGDTEISNIIAQAIDEVGQDGVVTVEEGFSSQHSLHINEGTQIPKGWITEHFVTDQARQRCVLEKPYIIICNDVLRSMTMLVPIINQIVSKGRSFFIICDDLEGEALHTLSLNARIGGARGAAIKAPFAGSTRSAVLEDLALITNTRVWSTKTGQDITKADLIQLGEADKVIIERSNTVIMGGKGSAELIEVRVNDLKEQINVTPHQYDKDIIKERIARLTGGVAVIGVGASTDLEMKEKKDRIEDALHATKAAIEDGIVPGGGTALIRASELIKKKFNTPGSKIVFDAISEPFKQILRNAGLEVDNLLEKVLSSKNKSYGLDVSAQKFGDLFKLGVIDPTKVVKQSLTNAVSIASLLLTSRCAIAIDPDDMNKYEESIKY